MPSNKSEHEKSNLDKKIIKLLAEGPLYLPDIYRVFKAKKRKEFKLIEKAVRRLEKRRIIAADRRGLLKAVVSKKCIKGKITVLARGFGFVENLDVPGESDIFVPAQHINGALDGDIVNVRVISEDENSGRKAGKGPVGIVDSILERKRPFLVGKLVVKRDGFYLRALNRKIPEDIRLIDNKTNSRSGDWIKAEVIYNGKKGIACKCIRKIGKVGNVEDDIDAVVAEYNLHEPYNEEQEKQAESVDAIDISREDLTELYCVTVDPHDAKDFDDAVSISEGENTNEVVLGVHIADVAAWVSPESWLDKEAAERGFTAYIPGRTLPMLPKTLTRKISLRADKENNFAHSVLITVDKKSGRIKKFRRCHSLVKIARRLTFKQMEGMINSTGKEEDTDLLKNVGMLISLYRAMRAYREEHEKFLGMETTEIRVLRDDETGHILGIERKKQSDADALVEEFMLAANSCVAKEFVNNQLPGIYRIHPEPEPEKLEEFSAFVHDVFGISTGDLSSGRKACQNFLNEIKGHKHAEVITSFFLRAMNRALYSEEYALHYGLGKGMYLHFTSPIRRYTDLIVHQQLLNKEQKKDIFSSDFVKGAAESCNELEKNNDEAFFAANDRLKLHYLQSLLVQKKSEMYEGIISSVNAGGMLADLPEIGLTAFIPIENISGTYNKRYGRLISERGGIEYKPGDFVFLKLEKIDFIKGSAVFTPVQY